MHLRFPFRPRSRSRATVAHRIGRRGERAAARALRRRGYRLLGRNLRTPLGEIDLLMQEGGQLVLVEVKSSAGAAESAVAARLRRRQRARLRRSGRWLVRRLRDGPKNFRIDLVTVTFDGRRPVVTIRRAAGGP